MKIFLNCKNRLFQLNLQLKLELILDDGNKRWAILSLPTAIRVDSPSADDGLNSYASVNAVVFLLSQNCSHIVCMKDFVTHLFDKT